MLRRLRRKFWTRQRYTLGVVDAVRSLTEVEFICPLAGRSVATHDLPSSLVVPPGLYQYRDSVWDMSSGGIYRFALDGYVVRQVVVPTYDPVKDCELVQSIHGYGTLDDGLASNRLLHMATSRRVWVTCSRAAQLVVAILRSCGHSSRVVMGMTLEDWNTFNNGHTVVEVKLPDGWKCFDPTVGSWPLVDGRTVSVFELTDAILSRRDFTFSETTYGRAVSYALVNRRHKDFLIEQVLSSKAETIKWYRRVMQAPGILTTKAWHFCSSDEANSRRLQAYAPEFMTHSASEFVRRFYET